MFAVLHDDIEVTAGDDWSISAALTNDDGTPYDLTSAAVYWALLDPDGTQLVDLMATAVLSDQGLPASGNIIIAVPSASTLGLVPGRYTDAIHAVVSGKTTMIWTGLILVDANPFSQPY